MNMHSAITNALLNVHQQYGEELFVEGDCHTLAVALMKSNSLQGTLVACMLDDATEAALELGDWIECTVSQPRAGRLVAQPNTDKALAYGRQLLADPASGWQKSAKPPANFARFA